MDYYTGKRIYGVLEVKHYLKWQRLVPWGARVGIINRLVLQFLKQADDDAELIKRLLDEDFEILFSEKHNDLP